MPTYEYICKSCGHLFEIVQSMRDESLTECPECGGVLRKVFAPPAISFKGSGFYATDQRKKAAKPSGEKSDGDGKSDKSPDPDSGSGDGKKDSKGDAKKDSKSDAPAASSKKETSSSSSGSTSDSSSGTSSGSSSKEGSGS